MPKYEIMVIISANLDEETIQKTIKDLEEILTKNKAKIVETTDWGHRELAYEIQKHNKGYYYIFQVEAEKNAVREFERLASINEHVLRHMIIRLD